MENIFISYARENIDVAQNIFSDLKNAGFDPWLDKNALLPGQNWKIEIKKAIKDCSQFLALLSSKSLSKRGYVQKELKVAFEVLDKIPDSDIFVIPARLDECRPSHEKLNELQWVDLFPSYKEGLKKILQALRPNSMDLFDKSLIQGLVKILVDKGSHKFQWFREKTAFNFSDALFNIIIETRPDIFESCILKSFDKEGNRITPGNEGIGLTKQYLSEQ